MKACILHLIPLIRLIDEGALAALEKERRKKGRAHFETEVVLRTGAYEMVTSAETKDMSIKGVFIKTDRKIPVGALCDIEIVLTGTSSRLSLKMKGSVVRQDKSGLGIVFDEIGLDSYFHLKNLLMYNASDPVALEKGMPSSK